MYVVDCTQMEPFWPPTALPSKAERTHVWYVSNIDCSLYPAGTALTSPTFTCGGLDGLCLKLFPKGTKKNRPGMAAACLSSNRDHGVVVCTCIHIDGVQVLQNTAHGEIHYSNWKWSLKNWTLPQGAFSVSMRLESIKHKRPPAEVQAMPCRKGAVLKIVSDWQSAKESFYVIGCDRSWCTRHKAYLGMTGAVVRVEKFKVQLEHHDGTQLWWGHGALMRDALSDLTAAQVDVTVDGMKVRRLKYV